MITEEVNKELSKWRLRLFDVVVFVFAISAIYGMWVNFEKQKLNQRYKRVIEQYEEKEVEISDLNQKIRVVLDQMMDRTSHLRS